MVVRSIWSLVSPMVHPRTRHKARWDLLRGHVCPSIRPVTTLSRSVCRWVYIGLLGDAILP